ncbi:MAG: LysM peptidoglycan-binding domain-containing protein [Candidatus Omnitrophota bacterium]|nr:LysM peptidoglycan-binding domain-containing protein [Candidatus Omnitrophota bacterium]
MRVVLLIIAVLFLGGCSVKTYTVEQQRVDTQLEGNQGYLCGNPPAESSNQENRLGSTRKTSVMEIEFGSYQRKKKGSNKIKAEYVPKKKETPKQKVEIEQVEVIEEENYPEVITVTDDYKWYTVAKSDTLQKISYKFFNTTKKWIYIFEQNKDILSSPDKIYPGMKIKIPELAVAK